MAPVVVDDASPHCSIGSILVDFPHCRIDSEPAGIAVLPVRLEHGLPHHFSDEFGVRGRIADRLPHDEGRVLGLLELPVADEPQFVHAPQNVELAGARPFRIGDGIEG